MTRFVSKVASEDSYELGEGPRWDARTARLTWLDIVNGLVLEGAWDDDAIRVVSRQQFDAPVGVAVRSAIGEQAIARSDRIVTISASGVTRQGPRLFQPRAGRRANDGACDPSGRLLVGSKGPGPESLVRVESNGSVTTLDDDLTLSNGIGWSPDGATMYLADTLAGIIWRRNYDTTTGAVGSRSIFQYLKGEYPDGLCVDTVGNVWVAIWGAGQVRCFSSGGEHLHTIEVDAPHVSSVAFIGAARDTLAITTAREGLSDSQLKVYPLSGRLFVADIDAVGLPQTLWEGTEGWKHSGDSSTC